MDDYTLWDALISPQMFYFYKCMAAMVMVGFALIWLAYNGKGKAMTKEKNREELEIEKIITLPDKLVIRDYLHLEGTGITALPANLTVGGSLHLQGTKITVPDNLVMGVYYLQDEKIITLPDKLVIRDYLHLEDTKITVPDNLTVGGSLHLQGTGMEREKQ